VNRNPGSWTARLWAEADDTYTAILEHPFIAGLTSGALDPNAFKAPKLDFGKLTRRKDQP